MGFQINVPKKRERNALVIAQAKGEAQKPARMSNKKYKAPRNRNSWKDEDWGECGEYEFSDNNKS